MSSEIFEISLRAVIKGGDALNGVVSRLTELYGSGTEADMFQERLVFTPKEQTGNMNFINRECLVDIVYERSHKILVKHLVSSVAVKTDIPSEVFAVRKSEAANANVRNVFLKAGFRPRHDFAKKGLRYKTQHDAFVTVTRPYNAQISVSSSNITGVPSWDNIGGQAPLGQDYLIEISTQVTEQSKIDATVEKLSLFLAKFIS
jgi:hypothetical protein